MRVTSRWPLWLYQRYSRVWERALLSAGWATLYVLCDAGVDAFPVQWRVMLAACIGVVRPLRAPTIVVKGTLAVKCSKRVSPTKRCAGKFLPASRTIVVTYSTFVSTTPHEMVHDLLQQAGHGLDRKHERSEWATCL